jgi:16S rRNA (guanine(966)-N(2))-methyltransferase RsmD
LLPVPDVPGLRPTPDRVRETLFNWLGQDLTGWRCVDAFGGCGGLGFEAASRGAAQVLIVEQHAGLIRQMQLLKDKLSAESIRLERGDGVTALQRQAPASMDLVLLDPPFDSALYPQALRAAAAAVRPDGWVYLEAPAQWTDQSLADLGLPQGLRVHRHVKAGAVHAHLLTISP